MSYFGKGAAGYNGHGGIDHYGILNESSRKTSDFRGPKDWIVTYPTNDPESGKVIGFRYLEDDIPRNSLAEKSESSVHLALAEKSSLGSGDCVQKAEGRIQQILGQCKYIASMKGMDVSEIRQKLHEDEQQYLQLQRVRNVDNSGPVYYFVNPPSLKMGQRKPAPVREPTYTSAFPNEIVPGDDELYNERIPADDEYSEEIIPLCAKTTDLDYRPPTGVKTGTGTETRKIYSPTDYEEEAEFNNFVNMVQRISEKCEKVKMDDKSFKM